MKAHKFFLFFIVSPVLCGCLYKAGNRQPDLNISIPVNVNTFYVDKYLRKHWMKPIYESPLNSEIINYPKDFVPLTDSLNKLKYVIELRVSGDSLNNNGYGLILSSIYDFGKHSWVTQRDSLKDDELSKFKLFFKEKILLQTVEEYEHQVPDKILFVNKSKEEIEIKTLN